MPIERRKRRHGQPNGDHHGVGWVGTSQHTGIADHPRCRAGPDAVAQQVGAALSEIGRQDEQGDRLMRLAGLRYGDDPAPTWLMQLHLLGIESRAKQTYYDQVHRLHERLLVVLAERSDAREWLTAGRGVLPQSLLKVASKLRRAG